MIKDNMTILFVEDQERSTSFFAEVLDLKPVLHVPGMTEFKLGKDSSLGLMPVSGMTQIIGREQFLSKGKQNPQAEIYLRVDNPQVYLDRSINAGAKMMAELQEWDWGESVGYCLTPDDHILAFAKATATPYLKDSI